MDSFDNYYNNLNKKENTEFNMEQQELFKFGSSKITMIFVIILWVLLIYPFISGFVVTGIDVTQYIDFENIPGGMPAGYEPTNVGGGIFGTVVQIVLSLIVPIGFLMVYNGSKTQNKHKVSDGLRYTKIYFQIQKVFLIIAAVIFGLVALFALLAAPLAALISLLIFGGIFYIVFKIYNMFIEFFNNLSLAALGKYRPIPLALNIKTVFVVLLILNLLGLFLVFGLLAIFANQASYFPEVAEYFDVPGFLRAFAPSVFISVGLTLGSSIYYIYYIDKYNKHFNEFNRYVRDMDKKQEELE